MFTPTVWVSFNGELGSGSDLICSTEKPPAGGSITGASTVIYRLNKRAEEEVAAQWECLLLKKESEAFEDMW